MDHVNAGDLLVRGDEYMVVTRVRHGEVFGRILTKAEWHSGDDFGGRAELRLGNEETLGETLHYPQDAQHRAQAPHTAREGIEYTMTTEIETTINALRIDGCDWTHDGEDTDGKQTGKTCDGVSDDSCAYCVRAAEAMESAADSYDEALEAASGGEFGEAAKRIQQGRATEGEFGASPVGRQVEAHIALVKEAFDAAVDAEADGWARNVELTGGEGAPGDAIEAGHFARAKALARKAVALVSSKRELAMAIAEAGAARHGCDTFADDFADAVLS